MKKWLAGMLVLCMMAVPCFAQEGPVPLQAPSAVLMTLDGKVLLEKDAHTQREPASVTKVMTMLLVCEAIDSGRLSPEDPVTATAHAASMGGSQIWLEEGERMTVSEMLKCVAVVSANDCCVALAEHLCGSEAAFVDRMNSRAKELGMNDTHFVNCTGLDDDPDASEHLTSAHDIALMSRELLKHDDIRKYTTIWMDTVRNGEFGLSNTNKLVRFYDGATGLKTGYTSGAGHCLSASAMRDGVEYVAVVLRCSNSNERFQSAKQLLDYGFANYTLAEPDLETAIPEVPVVLGSVEAIVPIPADASPLLIEKSMKNAITTHVEVAEQVKAPVEPGQRLGTMTMQANGEPLAAVPLVAPEAVARKTWWDVTKELLQTIWFRGSSKDGS